MSRTTWSLIAWIYRESCLGNNTKIDVIMVIEHRNNTTSNVCIRFYERTCICLKQLRYVCTALDMCHRSFDDRRMQTYRTTSTTYSFVWNPDTSQCKLIAANCRPLRRHHARFNVWQISWSCGKGTPFHTHSAASSQLPPAMEPSTQLCLSWGSNLQLWCLARTSKDGQPCVSCDSETVNIIISK